MKVETYTIKGWDDPIMGVVIDENDDWILISEVATDYHVDGFALLKKSYIKKRRTKKWEKQVALVLELQKFEPKMKKGFSFGTLESMLKWIESKYTIFAFQDQIEDSLEIGVVEDLSGNTLGLNFLKADGEFEPDYIYDYKVKKIRKITFDTYYLNALKILSKHKYS